MNEAHVSAEHENARHQFRITVDAGMGPFHAWLISLPPSVRSRELLYLMRVGFSLIHGGHHLLGAGVPLASSLAGASPVSASQDAAHSVGSATGQSAHGKRAVDASREQIEALDASWDLVSMCTPPPAEDLRRH